MDPIWVVGALLGLGSVVCLILFHGSLQNLPPGPIPWPFIGSLHLLGELPHQKFAKLAEKYGPIFFLRLGCKPVVVISSPMLAKEVLCDHDKTFAYRPYMEASNRMLYPNALGFLQWRGIRKLCTLQLFTARKLEEAKHIRMEEVLNMTRNMEADSGGGKVPVDVGAHLRCVIGNIICRQLISKRVSECESGGMPLTFIIRQMSVLSSALILGDFIPCLGCLDAITKRKMDRIHMLLDSFVKGVLAERESRTELASHDFLDVLLSLKRDGELKEEDIKAVLLDLIAAGFDTTSGVMEWVLAELVRNPSVMERLEEEVDSCGGGVMVEEEDIAPLTYLHAVMKEGLRLHPGAPLLVPHMASKACKLGGYHIPEKTTVMVNMWGMGKSQEIWGDTWHKFEPDRFINSNVDVTGQHFQLLPFGAGRRMCVGLPLAMSMMELILANIVRCFHLKLPYNQHQEELDMREHKGFTTHKAQPLMVLLELRHQQPSP